METFAEFLKSIESYKDYEGQIFITLYPEYVEFNKDCSWASQHPLKGISAIALVEALDKCKEFGFTVTS